MPTSVVLQAIPCLFPNDSVHTKDKAVAVAPVTPKKEKETKKKQRDKGKEWSGAPTPPHSNIPSDMVHVPGQLATGGRRKPTLLWRFTAEPPTAVAWPRK
ncbi:hypothetical protein Ct61P_14514 [Colletotrichum tofieldiae]|nr:hypothetical protein Ct61P_14514 [Colletotrichum tofieldiae]